MTMTDRQVQQVVDRLGTLYERVMTLRDGAGGSAASRATPYLPPARIPTRLESVRDALTGLEYGVWLIGETLAITGGDAAMHAVYDRFEAIHGVRASSWLDHRWNGVSASDALWVA